jgi:hypothetical protein
VSSTPSRSTPAAAAPRRGWPPAASPAPPRAQAAGRRLGALLAEPRATLLAAALLLAAVPCLDVLGDPDVWWHLRLGRWILDHLAVPHTELFTYTAQGAPMTAHEWLAETVFAALAAVGGLLLVALVVAAVAWSGLVACALRARARGAGALAIAAALVLGAKAAQPVLGTRPQVATFALTAWTLLLAERQLTRGGRACWLLPPLFLLWANLHAGFLGGLGILGAVLAVEAGRLVLARGRAVPAERVRGLATALGLSALAACVNPAGPGLYAYALQTTFRVKREPIVEWMPPNLHDPGLWPFLILALSVVLLVVLGRRCELRDRVLAAGAVVASFLAVRDVALLVAVALPAWAAAGSAATALAGGRRGPVARPPRRATAAAVGTGALVVLAGAAGLGVAVARAAADASPAGVAAVYPACAAAALRQAPPTVRLFAPYATSGYLAGQLWPRVLVYDYGELVAAGDRVLADDLRIAAGDTAPPSALSLLDASRTDAVLTPTGRLAAELGAGTTWHHVLTDHGMELWTRGVPAWTRAAAGCAS